MTTKRNAHRNKTNRILSFAGTIGLLGFTIIQLPTLADQLDELRRQSVHQSELANGSARSDRCTKLIEQRQLVQSKIDQLDAAMITSEEMAAVQTELMELARRSGCRLRKATMQAGSRETWELEKDPTEEEDDEYDSEESPYTLGTELISLSLTGTLEQVSSFLTELHEKPWLMTIAQINLAHSPDEEETLIVEASLTFYRLTKKTTQEEFVQWRDGSRAGKIQ